MVRFYIPLLFCFAALFAAGHTFAQGRPDPSELGEGSTTRARLLVGNWELTSHHPPGQPRVDCKPAEYALNYQFFPDSTFVDTKPGSPWQREGRWEITDGGNTLHLFDIHETPGTADTRFPDRYLQLLRLTETELRLPEQLFGQFQDPGVSVYQKTIPINP